MTTVILIVFLVTFPAFIIYLCKKIAFFNKLGAILLAYAFGLILGNLGILPENASKIIENILTISIPIALPLLLFSSNIHRWSKLAGRTFLSMILAIVALMIVIYSGFYFFHDKFENASQVAGMAVGVYVGGTANMAAIALALNVKSELYIMTHTSDMVVCAFYLLFYASVAQSLFLLFLPKFKMRKDSENIDIKQDFESYDGIFKKKTLIQLSIALGLALIIFAIGGSLSFIVPKKYEMAAVIITISALGIGASFIPSVRNLEKTFQLGMYFILIFSFAVAALGDLGNLINSSPYIFYYISYIVFGTSILHMLLSAIFRIDADTTIISQVALIMSAPFVPAAAAALKNREVIISGILVGIIGYSVGNFLGIMVAYSLQ